MSFASFRAHWKKLTVAVLLCAVSFHLLGIRSPEKWRKSRDYRAGRKKCQPLPELYRGIMTSCTEGMRYGSVCSFQCDEGFALRGSVCRRCQSNGLWSGYPTVCVPKYGCLARKGFKAKKAAKRQRALSVKASCCPPGLDGLVYDPSSSQCCHAGRLHWRNPPSSGLAASQECDCCAEHKHKCWTCCDEPIVTSAGRHKKTGEANFTWGAELDLDLDDFSDGFATDLKIVGGGPASSALRRFNAYLLYEDSVWLGEPIPGFPPICGGVLIHRRWVLTARHCVIDELCNAGKSKRSPKLRVVLGKRYNNHKTDGDGQVRSVDLVACHPHYCKNKRKPDLNDVALLRLSRDADTEKGDVAIATLPRQGEEANNWAKCRLTGWGITEKIGVFPYPDYRLWLQTYRNATPAELHEVRVPIVVNRRCSGLIRPCHLCAGALGRDGCSSDSGSPLFCRTKGPRGIPETRDWVVHGVFSAGTCGTSSALPSVYARVSYYRDWIDDVIETMTYA